MTIRILELNELRGIKNLSEDTAFGCEIDYGNIIEFISEYNHRAFHDENGTEYKNGSHFTRDEVDSSQYSTDAYTAVVNCLELRKNTITKNCDKRLLHALSTILECALSALLLRIANNSDDNEFRSKYRQILIDLANDAGWYSSLHCSDVDSGIIED